jgi:hypothetical protein
MKVANWFIVLSVLVLACKPERKNVLPEKGSYQYDLNFLYHNTKGALELSDSSGNARILLSAEYQGRVFTSTAAGDSGTSYGWLNYDLIASKKKRAHFNPVGGEERFWLGPEGGQFSLYFHAGDSFSISNWKVPAAIDTESYRLMRSSKTQAIFSHNATLTNYSQTTFQIGIERIITLLSKSDLEIELKIVMPSEIKFVAYQSVNTLKNEGEKDWTKETGLPSIWLLGMFTPSAETKVIIPFRGVKNSKEMISTNYFGDIPTERIDIRDSVLFFSCDGNYRSKIGLPPAIAKPFAASFDAKKNILTLIHFQLDPKGAYVNSKWELQKDPYQGDAVNSYNDGPLADGSQLGPFYELESSSVALALRAGESNTYTQTTCHFEGSFEQLNQLARQLLAIDLQELKK